MPKSSPLQPSFSGGEFDPKVQGRTDSERHKTALSEALNYIPTTQGPLIRRPGFKYSGADAKDPAKPPTFYEFKFSQTQNYVLEFGDFYLRFYSNNGQITTTSTHFKVSGTHWTTNAAFLASSNLYAMRSSPVPNPGEVFLASSVVLASSVLELQTPYSYTDAQDLKFSQKDDTVFFVHSSHPEYKLQRFGHTQWDLKKTRTLDGPYLALNSYKNAGDGVRWTIVPGTPALIYMDGSAEYVSAYVGPQFACSSVLTVNTSEVRVHTKIEHPFVTGDRVAIYGATGTTQVNNGTSSLTSLYWTVRYFSDTAFDLLGAEAGSTYIGGGVIFPAVFEAVDSPTNFIDVGRTLALIRTDAGRAWGTISNIRDAARFDFHVDSRHSPAVSATSAIYWYLGSWSRKTGYPNAITLHQSRKFLGGAPNSPLEIVGSVVGEYENFAPSGSSSVVTDASAIQRELSCDSKSPIFWLKSDVNALLAGSMSYEFKVTPSNQAQALTPSNFNAAVTGSFGSHNANAVQAGNTTIYIQKAQRRIRELNFFYQVDTYRSTDITELSRKSTGPALQRLSVQQEPVPICWGMRSDGQLVAMAYGRDDVALKIGVSRISLGGHSDSARSKPVVKSMAVIPSPDGTYDQLWVAVQRYINGTSVVTVEYSKDLYEDGDSLEDAFYVDCGGTYDSPVSITGISLSASSVVTAPSHGFADGEEITIRKVVGLQSSFIDARGVEFNSNRVNYHHFLVGSAGLNSFHLKELGGADVSTVGYSPYFSGGEVRKLVSAISGVTWLKNETVSVLADGKIHGPVTVNSAGVLALTFPAATVQFGYKYNSDAKTLRQDSGSADGSAIGKMRRSAIAALGLHDVGEISIGPSFDKLTQMASVQNFRADAAQADVAPPLFSGIAREPLESEFDYDGFVCWRQAEPLPGMVQTLTIVMETNDV